MSEDRKWHRPRGAAWGKPQEKRSIVPPGLKGRAIGMYFRDRKNQESQLQSQSKKNKIREVLVTLKIPATVKEQVDKNLNSINEIREKHNIPAAKVKFEKFDETKTEIIEIEDSAIDVESSDSDDVIFVDSSNFSDDVDVKEVKKNEKEEEASSTLVLDAIKKTEIEVSVKTEELVNTETDNFKKPEVPVRKIKKIELNEPQASSSNYIPIDKEDPNDFGSDEKLLALRGGGDYKYSYEDIITGTFDEKLDQCLSKGNKINTQNTDVTELNEIFYEEYQNMLNKPVYKKMMKFRETLPTYQKRNDLLNVINNNQVVVVSGETGCGKSTQVPQLILDEAIQSKRGGNVKILVTQPRRIAASSLASRVAEERGESPGNCVGYAVRLEKIEPRTRGSILFCTTGILLADMEVNQGVTEYSHVILDEVHERDCNIDLSMCMLKKVLKKRKDLKLILMSATIDAEKLSEYFDNCPMMHIEGLAFPVKDIYLEEILEMTQYQLPEAKPMRAQPKWAKYRDKGRACNEMEKEIQYRAEIGPWLESIKFNISKQTYLTLQDRRVEDLNYELQCDLILNICKGRPGAILVFLPGIGEITKLLNCLDDSGAFPKSRYVIYPLHSKLSSLEQHKIFETPPNGVRKIIVATNIAETSITIDDIVYVIDCGKLKLKGLDVEQHVSTLQVKWESEANLRQRRGRAGRCQPGICYHLMTTYRASTLAPRLLPELQRSDLLESLLVVKKLRLGYAADAFNEVPSPPDESTVRRTVKHLQRCGALDDKETLTPLGWHLARLPVHPSAGKLLVLGALFGCLDRAASVAAVWGFKDPFMLVIGKEQEVDLKKRQLARGEPSDQIAISEAIIQWESQPYSARHKFAYEYFLSGKTLELLSEMKQQFGDNLRSMGFLTNGNVKSKWENRNSDNLSLFKALVAASLYPNVCTARWKNLHSRKRMPSIIVRAAEHDGNHKLMIHPSSVMSQPKKSSYIPLCNNPGANWLVYWLKQRSTDLYLLEVTLVYTLPLLFFGELQVTVTPGADPSTDECMLSVSNVKVLVKKNAANLLFELRSLLDQVLASKVMDAGSYATKHSEFEEAVLNAVIQLITAEDERVDDVYDLSESDCSASDSSSERGGRRPKAKRMPVPQYNRGRQNRGQRHNRPYLSLPSDQWQPGRAPYFSQYYN